MTLKSACRNTLRSVCSNTVGYGVSSSDEFEKLRKHAKIAERMAKEASRMQTVRSVSHTGAAH